MDLCVLQPGYGSKKLDMKRLLLLIPVLFLFSCQNKTEVDAIYYNATIYTVDSVNTVAQAMAVKDGKIVCIGTKEAMLQKYHSANTIDLKGKFAYPGLIDAHGHFYSYGLFLSHLNLEGTTSWDEVIAKTKEYAASHPDGWIIGRAWDQNKWPTKEFPTNDELNKLFPDRPVFLTRIDGHACVANDKALELAHINAKSVIAGGKVILQNGAITGVLLDNAMDSLTKSIPSFDEKQVEEALLNAQKNCFAVGLTSVEDPGLMKGVIDIMDKLQKEGKLKMRIYAILSDNDKNREYYFQHGPYKTDRLDVHAFKFYADGALGSRGALLLQPYNDEPTSRGLQLSSTDYFLKHAQECYDHGFQMCTHAIGDSGNRMILQVYAAVLKGHNDRRWRVEHCQVIAPGDFHYFGDYNIIPSIQTTHATSDMYWAGDRLGPDRIKGAYAYKMLLEQNGWLANGSDFPVENINPLFGFYAAIARMDQKGFPKGGFQPENSLTREQALRGMTIWAARAAFEENEKGSLEPGKYADFVILDADIMTEPIEQTFSTKVLATYINGEKVFGN
jgi:predicted amidohydrolase YtcJ